MVRIVGTNRLPTNKQIMSSERHLGHTTPRSLSRTGSCSRQPHRVLSHNSSLLVTDGLLQQTTTPGPITQLLAPCHGRAPAADNHTGSYHTAPCHGRATAADNHTGSYHTAPRSLSRTGSCSRQPHRVLSHSSSLLVTDGLLQQTTTPGPITQLLAPCHGRAPAADDHTGSYHTTPRSLSRTGYCSRQPHRVLSHSSSLLVTDGLLQQTTTPGPITQLLVTDGLLQQTTTPGPITQLLAPCHGRAPAADNHTGSYHTAPRSLSRTGSCSRQPHRVLSHSSSLLVTDGLLQQTTTPGPITQLLAPCHGRATAADNHTGSYHTTPRSLSRTGYCSRQPHRVLSHSSSLPVTDGLLQQTTTPGPITQLLAPCHGRAPAADDHTGSYHTAPRSLSRTGSCSRQPHRVLSHNSSLPVTDGLLQQTTTPGPITQLLAPCHGRAPAADDHTGSYHTAPRSLSRTGSCSRQPHRVLSHSSSLLVTDGLLQQTTTPGPITQLLAPCHGRAPAADNHTGSYHTTPRSLSRTGSCSRQPHRVLSHSSLSRTGYCSRQPHRVLSHSSSLLVTDGLLQQTTTPGPITQLLAPCHGRAPAADNHTGSYHTAPRSLSRTGSCSRRPHRVLSHNSSLLVTDGLLHRRPHRVLSARNKKTRLQWAAITNTGHISSGKTLPGLMDVSSC
ncbi:uncharacterized protein ACWYII_032610 [Salvelinus alpinus]